MTVILARYETSERQTENSTASHGKLSLCMSWDCRAASPSYFGTAIVGSQSVKFLAPPKMAKRAVLGLPDGSARRGAGLRKTHPSPLQATSWWATRIRLGLDRGWRATTFIRTSAPGNAKPTVEVVPCTPWLIS